MGRPKIHKPKDSGGDLHPMFSQVVGTIFNLLDTTAAYWMRVKWSRPTSIYGFGLGEVEMPPPVKVSEDMLAANFREGFAQHQGAWTQALTTDVLNKVLEIGQMAREHFDFPTTLWAKVLYDFAVAHHRQGLPEQELLDSLIPLYYGKTLSYVRKTERMSVQQAEEFIENECMVFEETKPYLLERWSEQ
jgi:hypothetical protein